MTFVLGLVSPSVIHQCADFRIGQVARGQYKIINDCTPKQIVVANSAERWIALVAYAGIGSIGFLSTTKWIIQKLTSFRCPKSLRGMIKYLKFEMTKYFLRCAGNPIQHSAMLTYFGEENHGIALISNHLEIEQNGNAIVDRVFSGWDLQKSFGRDTRQVYAIGSGKDAFAKLGMRNRRLKHLERLSTAEECRLAHLYLYNRVNVVAQQDVTVGNSCSAVSLKPDGTGSGQILGQVIGNFVPPIILNGVNIDENILCEIQNDQRSIYSAFIFCES